MSRRSLLCCTHRIRSLRSRSHGMQLVSTCSTVDMEKSNCGTENPNPSSSTVGCTSLTVEMRFQSPLPCVRQVHTHCNADLHGENKFRCWLQNHPKSGSGAAKSKTDFLQGRTSQCLRTGETTWSLYGYPPSASEYVDTILEVSRLYSNTWHTEDTTSALSA